MKDSIILIKKTYKYDLQVVDWPLACSLADVVFSLVQIIEPVPPRDFFLHSATYVRQEAHVLSMYWKSTYITFNFVSDDHD